MKKIIKYLFALLIVAGIGSGCNNFLSPSVDQNKPVDGTITSGSDMQAVVYGAYDDLNRVELFGRDFLVSGEAMSDNAFSNGNSGRFITQDQMNFTINSGYALGVWQYFYEVIADANIAINADVPSSPEVDEYRGQAYAIRAFAHMNLLLAFGQEYVTGGDPNGGIPYVTTYNEGNFYPSRDAIADVWAKIGQDFDSALNLLDPTNFRVTEMNYWATRALQSRYYLYTKQYDNVKTAAEEIINSGNFSITPANQYVATWHSGSGPSSLFELAFTTTDRLGTDNIARIYRNTNYGDVEVSSDLYNAYDANDIRLGLYSDNAGTYRMVGKYFDELGSDNVRIIRYAEVILNYAEALAQDPATQGEALNQLTKITSNRNEPAYTAGTVDNVLLERRLELAMEGQRFYDLARTGSDLPVGDSRSYRSSVIPYGDYRYALPIPDSEIRANSNVNQNEGYK
ncbi:MAG TPA: RagB/SusD family nutrient uptake outer membrane protein [Balneolaceae bacterium]|nr:RagB/SusD family nutrient uptake outer membrane protein [Balneolaceae bacterium]